jgi:transposase
MRVLVVAREQMAAERTRAINALTALVRTINPGVDARQSLTAGQIVTIAGWRSRAEDTTTAMCRQEAVRLARRSRTLDHDLANNRVAVAEPVRTDTPQLVKAHRGRSGRRCERADRPVAPRTGSLRSSHGLPGRHLPDPASSGQHHPPPRLNRGGDRQLNRGLTTITIVLMRVDPATRAYVARWRGEGRTTKEIMPLPEALHHPLFRALATAHPSTTAAT